MRRARPVEIVWLLVAWALVPLSAVSCTDDAPDLPDPGSREEARRLRGVLSDDPTASGLDDVEDVVRRGLPVRAAQLLRGGVLAAASRHVVQVGELALTDPVVGGLQQEAVEALRLRASSLEEYAALLERGPVEDLALVECLGRQREAATRLAGVLERLEELISGPD